jgi:prevent-host-death family protein
MRDVYSLYEAKARLSAIVRQVREGRRVIVTVHGEPVAEIRPITRNTGDISKRLDALADRGILVRGGQNANRPRLVARRPGALRRFLSERDG